MTLSWDIFDGNRRIVASVAEARGLAGVRDALRAAGLTLREDKGWRVRETAVVAGHTHTPEIAAAALLASETAEWKSIFVGMLPR